MKPLKESVIRDARDRYLEVYATPPAQFNIAYSNKNGWSAEFHENETCWSEGFVTWMTGEPALNLFFSLDPSDVDLSSWDSELNDD